MKKKKLAIVGLAVLMLTGCGFPFSSGTAVKTQVWDETASSTQDSTEDTSAGFDNEVNTSIETTAGDATQKLIKTVDISMETKKFDSAVKQIETNTKNSGGYIESSSVREGGYQSDKENRTADIVIRIPQEKLDAYLQEMGTLGKITEQTMQTENITLQYADTKSHKEALQVEYDRIMELLKKADKMEDILALEEHLSDLRYQLNQYGSTLKTYDNQVDYSTISITMKEVNRIVENKGGMFGEIKNGFCENVIQIGQDARNFFIWFFVMLPYFIIWGMIIAVVVFVWKKIRKKHSRKKQKIEEKIQQSK